MVSRVLPPVSVSSSSVAGTYHICGHTFCLHIWPKVPLRYSFMRLPPEWFPFVYFCHNQLGLVWVKALEVRSSEGHSIQFSFYKYVLARLLPYLCSFSPTVWQFPVSLIANIGVHPARSEVLCHWECLGMRSVCYARLAFLSGPYQGAINNSFFSLLFWSHCGSTV